MGEELEGWLVAQQVTDGVEMVIGAHRDPEMGPAIMVGMGGVWLELIKDVAFSIPPISNEKARDMIAQTHAGRLLQGYRGSPALDVGAVVRAIVALGRIATDLGDVVQSIDVNPFMVMPDGQGGMALDALVVLQQK